MGAAAAVLLGAGLLLMIVPPLARDGVCGITSCADQVPVIAVSRLSATDLAIVVPDEAASIVSTVELLQGAGRASGSRQWLIRHEDGGASPSTFVMGAEAQGFRTVVPLDVPPEKGVWTAQVGFRCTTASLPFDPEAVAVGEVRSWDGVMAGNEFSELANTTEHCATERGTTETVLFLVGAVLAVVGAVLGIVVVLRRPVRFPDDVDSGDGDDTTGNDADQPD